MRDGLWLFVHGRRETLRGGKIREVKHWALYLLLSVLASWCSQLTSDPQILHWLSCVKCGGLGWAGWPLPWKPAENWFGQQAEVAVLLLTNNCFSATKFQLQVVWGEDRELCRISLVPSTSVLLYLWNSSGEGRKNCSVFRPTQYCKGNLALSKTSLA